MPNELLSQKQQDLGNDLAKLGNILVAYSGGVDSSLLAYFSRLVLGENATIVIAVSPSLAQAELDFAREQAKQFNWNLQEIYTDEVDLEEYKRNDEMRCYFCKEALFQTMHKLAQEKNIKYLAYGANVDDLSDFRPGHQAARNYQVLSPLQKANLTKEDIRVLARTAGLPSWNKPQAACLSSRFPTFMPITKDKLSQVEQAEAYLSSLGLIGARVRHHEELARIEVLPEQMPLILSGSISLSDIAAHLKMLGYTYVTLDLEGYRQGSSNNFVDTKIINKIAHNKIVTT